MRIRTEHDSCDLNLVGLLDLTVRNMNRDESLPGPSHQKPFAPPPGEKLRHAGAARRLVVRRDQVIKQLQGSWPSFQRSVDHGHHVIEMHAWRSPWRLAQQAEIKSRGLCAFLLVEDDASMRESLKQVSDHSRASGKRCSKDVGSSRPRHSDA
jgi:hypothetical protein